MKKFLYACLGGAALMMASVGHADFYAGAGYGFAFHGGSAYSDGKRSSYENSAMYSLQGGYILPLPLFDVRGEVEYLRARPEPKNQGSRRLDALMGNVSAVIPLVPIVDPYVGLGWGYARYDHNNTTAWQYQMGVEYSFVAAPVTVGAEYRYLKLTETCGKHDDISKYHSNVLMLKLKFMF